MVNTSKESISVKVGTVTLLKGKKKQPTKKKKQQKWTHTNTKKKKRYWNHPLLWQMLRKLLQEPLSFLPVFHLPTCHSWGDKKKKINCL